MSVAEAKRWNQVLGDFIELKEAGRLWLEAIDKLANLNTKQSAKQREIMLSRLDDLEAVFRRILVAP